jgi:hypothetical protein
MLTFVFLVGDDTHCMMGWIHGDHEPDVSDQLKQMFKDKYHRDANVVEIYRPDISKDSMAVIYAGEHS